MKGLERAWYNNMNPKRYLRLKKRAKKKIYKSTARIEKFEMERAQAYIKHNTPNENIKPPIEVIIISGLLNVLRIKEEDRKESL